MANFVVSEKWKELKEGDSVTYGGLALKIGESAFADVNAAVAALIEANKKIDADLPVGAEPEYNDTIILADKDISFTKALDAFKDLTYNIKFASSDDAEKVSGKLTIDGANMNAVATAPEGDSEDDSEDGPKLGKIYFDKFADVAITNKADVNEVNAIVKTDDDDTVKISANGKITVDGGSKIYSVNGYKNIEISGKDTYVDYVEMYDNREDGDGERIFEGTKVYDDGGRWIGAEIKNTASVTVSDEAVVGDISGVKNVTIEKASVEGGVSGKTGIYDFDKVYVGDDEDLFGTYEVDDEGNYSKVTVTDKNDWAGDLGSIKIAAEYKAEGAAKLEEGVIVEGEISDFANVTADDAAIANGIYLSAQKSYTKTLDFEDVKDGDDKYFAVSDKEVTKIKRGGSVKLKDVEVGYWEEDEEGNKNFSAAAITGFNSVVLADSKAGDIINASNRVLDEYETYEKYDSADSYRKGGYADSEYTFYKTNTKDTASGSVKVTSEEAGGVVGDIIGYSNVTLSAAEDFRLEAGYIEGEDNFAKKEQEDRFETREYDEKYTDLVSGGFIDRKYTENEKRTAAGSLKLTNVDAGYVSCISKVSLNNSTIRYAILNLNRSEKENITVNTKDDGTVVYKSSESESSSMTGSFTAVDSLVKDDIGGYATVKLTNTSAVNGIDGYLKISESTSFNAEYDDYVDYYYAGNNQADYDYVYDDRVDEYYRIHDAAEGKYTSKYSSGMTGSVTIKLDKDAVAPTEENPFPYECGAITNYAKVTISGIEKDDKTLIKPQVGDITGADTTSSSVKSDILYVEGSNGAVTTINGESTVKITKKVAGTVKLTDVDAGYISGYKSVTIADSSIDGAYTNADEGSGYDWTNNESYAYETDDKGAVTEVYSEKSTAKATGSFSAKNSTVDGGIGGFKTVKLVNTIVNNDYSVRSFADYKGQWDSVYTYSDADWNGKTGEGSYESSRKMVGSFSYSLDKKTIEEFAGKDFTVGYIDNFAKVTVSGLENVAVTTGSISADGDQEEIGTEKYKDGKLVESIKTTTTSAAGSVTLKDNVTVDGSIIGYQKVTAADTFVDGDIKGGKWIETEKYDGSKTETVTVTEVAGSVTLSDTIVSGDIAGFQKVAFKDGANAIGSYTGDDCGTGQEAGDVAETIDIAKKATVIVTQDITLQKEDTLNVNGELVLWGVDVEPDQEGSDAVTLIGGGIEEISGKGTVYAANNAVAALDKIKGEATIVDLKDTAYGFTGSGEFAGLDNSAAIEWDADVDVITGWVGNLGDLTDTVDRIKFTATEDLEGYIDVYGAETGFSLTINGVDYNVYDDFVSFAKGASYDIVFSRTDEKAAASNGFRIELVSQQD